MTNPKIAVLLSTYNGERFLPEQLQSLRGQTVQDFELVVRDDGSSDATLALLDQAATECPDQVRIVRDQHPRLGPKASFASLLGRTDARYVAFCDQDDFWQPDKLEKLLAAIEREEARHGVDTPVLACSDAAVTDAQLRVTDPSYFAKHRFSTADDRDLALPRLLFRNYAIGATTMINAALARRCRDMPGEAIMHDWWAALVACVAGRAVVVQEPLILYRQHGANAVGSKRRSLPRSAREAREALSWSQDSVARCVRQAQALYRAMGASANDEQRAVLERYSRFAAQSALGRAHTVFRTRAFKPGLALNGLHLYACMTAPL